jgi:AcrR family transcriptional regulator
MRAMLEACGERGYRGVSVQSVIDRYGGNRHQFYAHFPNKAQCYAAAYEYETDRRYRALMEAARAEPTWARALSTALQQLADLLASEPALARGLLVEVHVAGGSALRRRSQLVTNLTSAIDSARKHAPLRHSPPPMTASFMLGAIESFVTTALLRDAPGEFADGLPQLAEMVLTAYFGPDEAARQRG